jgi:beta-lactamase regulating signal transducer with metallopeptidase domain
MTALAIFSIIAAGLVLLAGRRDPARDPRLTFSLLMLTALLPLMGALLPKYGVLPARQIPAGDAGFPWAAVLSVIWALGFLTGLARLGMAAFALGRWRKRSVAITESGGVQIRGLHGLRGPVAAGIFRPVVFVPQAWDGWPEERREMVLRHELAHHRRRDPLWLLCAELARAALWFHPLAHWMARRFALQCEYACDEAVLRAGADAGRYAGLLCDFAEERSSTPFALAMADSPSLEKRVVRMFRPAARVGTLTFALLGISGIAAACALSMIARQQSPPDKAEIQLRLSADPFPGER